MNRASIRGLGIGAERGERGLNGAPPSRTLYLPAARAPPMPRWLDLLAAVATVVGGVLALLLYVLVAGLVIGAIAYVAAKVYRWLEDHL